MTTLRPIEQATLKALADVCNYSLSAHVPSESVARKFPKHLRGDVKKSLNKLRAKGLCYKHPTGRNITWQLTRSGLRMAQTNF